MELRTYPLDDVDYDYSDAALFHCTRTTGIYAEDDFGYSLSGSDNILKLSPGIAWMRINRFKGIVTALKAETSVDLGLPDSVYPRIDHVVLQFDANKNSIETVVKSGSPGSNPYPPERSMTEALFEIHLYQVRREPGAVSISAGNVTDLRLNENYCGLMAESVTRIDTKAINDQVKALIESLQKEIESVKAGTAYVLKSGDTMTGPLEVPSPTEDTHAANKAYVDSKRITATATITTTWTGSAAPYTQDVAVSGLLATDTPHITPVYSDTLATALAQKEAWALVSEADAGVGKITFTCFEDKPTTAIPIQIEVLR